MKKLLVYLFALAMLATPALALIPPHINVVNSQIYTPNINNLSDHQAEMLRELGLFLGTDKGFELDRGLTRAEAAVMLVRLLGQEQNALSGRNSHPFTDVPVWADKYVGWLWANGMTRGVGVTLYGSNQPIDYRQYATMLSRALSGDDDYISRGVGSQSEQELCEGNRRFARADAVGLSVRVLGLPYTAGEDYTTLAERLVGQGVFSAEDFLEAAANIFPINYYYDHDNGDRLFGELAGVRVMTGKLAGVAGNTACCMAELPYFYAWTDDAAGLTLYRMDCLTLEETRLGSYLSGGVGEEGRYVNYLGGVGGADYLQLLRGDISTLVGVEGDKDFILAEGLKIDSSFASDEALIVSTEHELYSLKGKEARKYILTAGAKAVGLEGVIAVLCREEKGRVTVEGLELENWTITDRYEVGPCAGDNPPLRRHDNGIYGEAGWYAVSEGRLIQRTARPVMAVGGVRMGAAGRWIFLSHEQGGAEYIGTTIIRLEEDGSEAMLLTNNPPHGIAIAGIEGLDSSVLFYSLLPVGMGHYDKYTYMCAYNEADGHEAIYVFAYEAGRPEMMEHDELWYIRSEQQRLNALGYNPSD